MKDRADTEARVREIDDLYRAKAQAEIEAAHKLMAAGVRGQGDPLAEVLLIKGRPGAQDRAAGRALAGDDGVAIGKALDALGLPKARYALCTRAGKGSNARRGIRLLVEAIDPRYVILLDADAAADFAAAFEAQPPAPGVVVRVRGRAVLAVDDFAASLGDESRKRKAWKQLRGIAASIRP